MILPRLTKQQIEKLNHILRLYPKISRMLLNQYLSAVFNVAPIVLELKSEPIDEDSSGTSIVIDHVDGMRIKIYDICFVVADAVNVQLLNGSEALTGVMNFANAGEGLVDSKEPPNYIWELAKNADFKISLSAGVSVDGWVCYWLEES